MKNRQVYVLAALLALIAIGVFAYKLVVLKLPLQVDTQVNTWDIEVTISFQARGGPAKVELYLPQSEGRYELYDERFISGDYGLAIRRYVNNRRAVWSVRAANGQQFLLYRASLRPLPRVRPLHPKNPPKLQAADFSGARLAAANNLLALVRKHSADVDSLVSVLLTELAAADGDDNVRLLLGRDSGIQHRAEVARGVLALAGIPARVVHGFELQSLARQAKRVHWLEVYDQGAWVGFDVRDGSGELPDNYLPWWRDDHPLYKVVGGRQVSVRVASNINAQSALHRSGDASALMDYSLLSLPLETQAVYHILLLVPMGVFLLVVMRNVVGIKTFGTFMPVLIALAFRETQLLVGILLFSLLVGLGLSIRFYLDRLQLLLVPRLASVLIVVIMLMALISIFSYKLGLPRGLSIALFPMVIMTMTIERMSIVWEERGAMEALQQGGGSLLVAALAYMVMNLQGLGHFIFVFPESLLLLLAGTLLLGRYSGYRLSELIRFRSLFGGR
jgi:hypothetical protein